MPRIRGPIRGRLLAPGMETKEQAEARNTYKKWMSTLVYEHLNLGTKKWGVELSNGKVFAVKSLRKLELEDEAFALEQRCKKGDSVELMGAAKVGLHKNMENYMIHATVADGLVFKVELTTAKTVLSQFSKLAREEKKMPELYLALTEAQGPSENGAWSWKFSTPKALALPGVGEAEALGSI
jgi:hypothetical protein